MPVGNQTPVRKPAQNNSRKKRKRRRGPLIRFRFGILISIWIFSLLICFAHYMYDRNFNPDKDVFVKKTPKAETSVQTPETSKPAEEPVNSAAAPTAESKAEEQSTPAEESSGVTIPGKINPVPESEPQTAEYLQLCAFLGEKTIHSFGEAGLLGTMNVYASDTLTLSNYDTEYVMLNGTTIRILSAINGAKCPIYLMFGTEQLAAGKKSDQVSDYFSALLYAVKSRAPSAEIFVLSIPPVTAAAEKPADKKTPAVLNSEIDNYNSKLLELANEANVYYVDTNTALRNDSGRLDPQYAEEDGIHLTADAGRIVLDYILKHVPNA